MFEIKNTLKIQIILKRFNDQFSNSDRRFAGDL